MKNFRDAALASALNMAIIIGFLCLAVWWMSSNFGAVSALATVGGLIMATVLFVGVRVGGNLVRDTQRHTLENLTDTISAIEETRTAAARGGNALQTAQAKIAVIDYQEQVRRQQETRQQIQRALTDALGQQPQPAAAWAMDDVDDDGGKVLYYE